MQLSSSVLLALAFQLVNVSAFNSTYAMTAEEQATVLDEHNKLRALHADTNPLTWSDTLAGYAQDYAAKYDCSGVLTHSKGAYGENLAIGYSTLGTVDAWYNEISSYNYSAPGFSSKTGHFTQVVWKDTTQVGCAIKYCGDVWHNYIVCEYDPAGNYLGEFAAEVEPLKANLPASSSSSSTSSTSSTSSSTSTSTSSSSTSSSTSITSSSSSSAISSSTTSSVNRAVSVTASVKSESTADAYYGSNNSTTSSGSSTDTLDADQKSRSITTSITASTGLTADRNGNTDDNTATDVNANGHDAIAANRNSIVTDTVHSKRTTTQVVTHCSDNVCSESTTVATLDVTETVHARSTVTKVVTHCSDDVCTLSTLIATTTASKKDSEHGVDAYDQESTVVTTVENGITITKTVPCSNFAQATSTADESSETNSAATTSATVGSATADNASEGNNNQGVDAKPQNVNVITTTVGPVAYTNGTTETTVTTITRRTTQISTLQCSTCANGARSTSAANEEGAHVTIEQQQAASSSKVIVSTIQSVAAYEGVAAQINGWNSFSFVAVLISALLL